jgi:uncharacterized protein
VKTSADRVPLVLYEPPAQQPEQDCACASEGRAPMALYSRAAQLVETDCACAEPGRTPMTQPHGDPAVQWRRSRHLHHTKVAETCDVIFNSDGPRAIAVLNAPAQRILGSFVIPTTSDEVAWRFQDMNPNHVHDAVQDLAALNLIQPVASRLDLLSHPSIEAPRTLSAWLHISNACNLSCSYCYVRKTDEGMNEKTGKAAVDAVFRSAVAHDFSAVKLKYAGGEPTMAFDLVRVLHHRAEASVGSTGLHLSEVLLTNGTLLTPTILDFVREAGMRLCISLDGIGPVHDAQRHFPNGQGSFAQVEQGIDQALAFGVPLYLSITVTIRNVDGIADVVSFALDRNLLFNLNFYRPCDSKAVQDELKADPECLIAGMRRALAVIEARLPNYSLVGAMVDRANFGVPHVHTCGAGRSYLVIDQRGQIARCQMEIENPVTDIHEEDPLAAILQAEGFRNPSVEEKDCGNCPWRYWCAGGCPLLTHKATGRYDARSPYCRVYQALYPEIVRLEGLRLLKWP